LLVFPYLLNSLVDPFRLIVLMISPSQTECRKTKNKTGRSAKKEEQISRQKENFRWNQSITLTISEVDQSLREKSTFKLLITIEPIPLTCKGKQGCPNGFEFLRLSSDYFGSDIERFKVHPKVITYRKPKVSFVRKWLFKQN
jgi:hypothetical protein